MTDDDIIRAVTDLVHHRRGGWPVLTELAVQDALADEFTRWGLPAYREHRLGPSARPDFLIGGVAVEVKIGGSPAQVIRQLARYATFGEVTAVLLLSSKPRHVAAVPAAVGGKRAAAVPLVKVAAW